MSRMRKLLATLALVAVAALGLAACGSSSSDNSSSSTPSSTPAAGGGGGSGGSGGGGGGGGTASGGSSTVDISADPSGALKYEETSASASAGKVTVNFTNDSSTPHNVTIE